MAAVASSLMQAQPQPPPHTLEKTLGFWDLIGFGIASIMGSGGFNFISKGVVDAGPAFPLSIGAVAALFQGASKVYDEAYKAFKTNTSESDVVKKVLGKPAAIFTAICILGFNIFSVSTILVFTTKNLAPQGKWHGQVGLALLILAAMTGVSLKGMEFTKDIVNLFSLVIVGLLLFGSAIGLWEGFGPDGTPPDTYPASLMPVRNFRESILLFYFVLAGFDTNMKFTEESKNPDVDIPKSFYWSNGLSALLTFGISYAFMHVLTLKSYKTPPTDNALGLIIESALGAPSAKVIYWVSIFLMLVTAYVSYLTVTRYLFGISEQVKDDNDKEQTWIEKVFESMRVLDEHRVPVRSVLVTSILAAIGILMNHTSVLLRLSDIFSLLTTLTVSVAVATLRSQKGEIPWVETATVGGLAWILSACCWPF